MTHVTWASLSQNLSGEGINSGSHTYFFDLTRTCRAFPDEGPAPCRGHLWDNTNMKDYTHHSLIHSNNVDMKGWLWWWNDSWGPCGLKTLWHLSYRWGKTQKKPHPGNLSWLGIEPGPTAWQAHILPPAPQQWTRAKITRVNMVTTKHKLWCGG